MWLFAIGGSEELSCRELEQSFALSLVVRSWLGARVTRVAVAWRIHTVGLGGELRHVLVQLLVISHSFGYYYIYIV